MNVKKIISVTRVLYAVGRKSFELAKKYKQLKQKSNETDKKHH